IAHAVRACANRHVEYLVYSNFSYGNKQHDGLSDFKERNGFTKVVVPRYYVPLTAKGQLALRFGLHKGLVDLLPESVLSTGRQLRKAWYERRVPEGAM